MLNGGYGAVRLWELDHPMNKGELYYIQLIDGVKLYICCPGCGICSFTGTHKVTGSNGIYTVSPSLVYDCCGWHGHLKEGVFSLA